MNDPRCVLCGRTFPTGLQIHGCFLCFPCEKALLQPFAALRLPPGRRRRLARLARGLEA